MLIEVRNESNFDTNFKLKMNGSLKPISLNEQA